jgi:hypothetical protein
VKNNTIRWPSGVIDTIPEVKIPVGSGNAKSSGSSASGDFGFGAGVAAPDGGGSPETPERTGDRAFFFINARIFIGVSSLWMISPCPACRISSS